MTINLQIAIVKMCGLEALNEQRHIASNNEEIL